MNLKRNTDIFQNHMLHELEFNFSNVSIIKKNNIGTLNFDYNIPGYQFQYVYLRTPFSAKGIMYIYQ